MNTPTNSLSNTIVRAAVTIIVVAVAARLIWWLLAPLLPALGVILVLGGIIAFVLRGPRSHR